jgi:hypothetical protein
VKKLKDKPFALVGVHVGGRRRLVILHSARRPAA